MNGLIAAAGLGLAGWLWWGNRSIVTTEYRVTSPALPRGFRGFRMAHIADWHNAPFTRALQKRVQAAAPHIICITGDFLDARRTDIPGALRTARALAELAPCYYVMGNHEDRIPMYSEFEAGLLAAGVHVLHNEAVTLRRKGDTVTLLGADDPGRRTDFPWVLDTLRQQAPDFALLLCHRPERFRDYCHTGFHVVLTGHAHGGQVRLPIIGGVVAPHQGFFPQYDAGVYRQGDTAMVLSRGLGNSLCPLRVNNRPELVIVELA